MSSHSGPGVECWVGGESQDCAADGDSAFVNSSKDRFDDTGDRGGIVGWFETGVAGVAAGWLEEAGVEVGAIGWFDEADEAGVEVGAVGWFDEAGVRGGTTAWETQMIEPGGLGFLAPEDTVTCTNTRSSELYM